MSAVARYVNEQCIRYEELAAEDASRSLYDVSDKAFVIRSALDYGAEDLAAEVRSLAEGNRLNGIFVTESTADSAVGRVVSYYSDGEDDATTWESYFKTFGSVAGDTLKSYCERLQWCRAATVTARCCAINANAWRTWRTKGFLSPLF